MKIKVLPEDFIVEELSSLPVLKKGDYSLYKLEKRYWNTTDALIHLAKKNRLPLKSFSYGGRKDRYAKTSQFITVFQNKLNINTDNDNLKLTFLGYLNEPFKPKHIKANYFQITLRGLSIDEAEKISNKFLLRQKIGFPNYFGQQRFGSYDSKCGFFGEKFLKAQYNGALKAVFCSIYSEDSKLDKERKELLFTHWGDFDYCLTIARTALEKRVFSFLKDNPKKFLNAIHLLPLNDISLYFSAYQSFLWNKMLDKLLRQHLKQEAVVPIAIKNWTFASFSNLSEGEIEYFKSIKICSHGLSPYFYNDEIEKLYDGVLKEEGLHQGRFNFRHYRKVIIKSFLREAIVYIEKGDITSPQKDEIYNGCFKLTLSFVLPKGSFATTLLKHLE